MRQMHYFARSKLPLLERLLGLKFYGRPNWLFLLLISCVLFLFYFFIFIKNSLLIIKTYSI